MSYLSVKSAIVSASMLAVMAGASSIAGPGVASSLDPNSEPPTNREIRLQEEFRDCVTRNLGDFARTNGIPLNNLDPRASVHRHSNSLIESSGSVYLTHGMGSRPDGTFHTRVRIETSRDVVMIDNRVQFYARFALMGTQGNQFGGNVLMITGDSNGNLSTRTGSIGDYPGVVNSILGPDAAPRFFEALQRCGFDTAPTRRRTPEAP